MIPGDACVVLVHVLLVQFCLNRTAFIFDDLSDLCSLSVYGSAYCRTGVSSETAKGLLRYFNETLPKHLLYKFEQPQYAEVIV